MVDNTIRRLRCSKVRIHIIINIRNDTQAMISFQSYVEPNHWYISMKKCNTHLTNRVNMGYAMACKYHPAGNIIGESVYAVGPPGSACRNCSLNRLACSNLFHGLCGLGEETSCYCRWNTDFSYTMRIDPPHTRYAHPSESHVVAVVVIAGIIWIVGMITLIHKLR